MEPNDLFEFVRGEIKDLDEDKDKRQSTSAEDMVNFRIHFFELTAEFRELLENPASGKILCVL